MKARRRIWVSLALMGALAAIVAAGASLYRRRQDQDAAALPVAPARKGEFLVIVRSRGDLKAGRSAQIYAPIVPNLTIAWMSPAGELVEEGEPVIRFDSSSAQQQLVQKEA